MKYILVLLAAIFLPFYSFSQSNSPVTTKFVVEGGIEFGGDELFTVQFEDGDDQTIYAGQGGYISVGLDLEFKKLEKVFVRSMIGYKYVTTAAENADVTFTRIPFYMTAFYKLTPDIRAGLGFVTQSNAKLNGDGFLPDVEFDVQPGVRLEFGYKWIALTYSAVTYKAPLGGELSGNSVGVSVSMTF